MKMHTRRKISLMQVYVALILFSKCIVYTQLIASNFDVDDYSPYWYDPDVEDTRKPAPPHTFDADDLRITPKCRIGIKKCDDLNYYRSIDGSCNNQEFPHFGISGSKLTRMLTPEFDFGVMRMTSEDGGMLPNPRFISNNMKSMKKGIPTDVNTLWLFFGQFVDHDLILVPTSKDANPKLDCRSCDSWKSHSGCAPIPVPLNERVFESRRENGKSFCLPFIRSVASPTSMHFSESPRLEQINFNTAYLDLSVVYGSNQCVEDDLRAFHSGLLSECMTIDGKGMMPLQAAEDSSDCRNFNGKCTLAGDERNSEQIGIALFHVLFLREHNRLARNLKRLNDHWQDKKLFQEARKINIAQYQKLVYGEFLPLLLGKRHMDLYHLSLIDGRSYHHNYDATKNVQIMSEFSTAAFRFGHTLVPDHLMKMNNYFLPTGSVALVDVFRNISVLYEEDALEDFTRGLSATRVRAFDAVVESSLSDDLFIEKPNRFTAQDLVALNIARGRDHGLPSYTKYRKICGLKPVDSWDDLGTSKHNLKLLRSSYSSVHDMDLFIGGLIENAVDGGIVGPTFACIIGEQFRRIKQGDQYWFENKQNRMTISQINTISEGSVLARVISFNVEKYIYLPEYIFLLPDKRRNPLISSKNRADLDFSLWRDFRPYSESTCEYRGELFKTNYPVFISKCLRCFCDRNDKISCVEMYDACDKYGQEMDEHCKIACGTLV